MVSTIVGVLETAVAAELAGLVDFADLTDVADLTARSDAAEVVEAILEVFERAGIESVSNEVAGCS